MFDKEKLLENLRRRDFDPYYFETGEEAIKKILEMIPHDATVGYGGSVTLDTLKIKDKLKERGNTLLGRLPDKDSKESLRLMHEALLSDYFLMSTNALTLEGELFNIDGRGNRLAALLYGPKYVFIVLGVNKIVKDFDSAYDRVRNLAAPKNSERLNCNTPCRTLNRCMDCKSPDCICCHMVRTRKSMEKDRIKIFIINEELGF